MFTNSERRAAEQTAYGGTRREECAEGFNVTTEAPRGLPATVQGGTMIDEKNKVAQVMFIPAGNSASARTVRIHEALHARHSRYRMSRHAKEFGMSATQAVEDAKIHALFPVGGTVPSAIARDLLACSLLDTRETGRHIAEALSNWGSRQLSATVLVRALASAVRVKEDGPRGLATAAGRLVDAVSETARASGISFTRLARCVAFAAKGRRYRRKALREFVLALGDPPRGERDPMRERVEREEGTRDGTAPVEMAMILPALTVDCDATSAERTAAPVGARFIGARLAAAVASLRTDGLFARQVATVPAGTWLIDASGSMGFSNERLAALCAALPAATIAIYTGEGDGGYVPPAGVFGPNGTPTPCNGILAIVARDGKRLDPASEHGAALFGYCEGNAVDRAALEWLMTQDGPRHFISDGRFCGGKDGQSSDAHDLLDCAVAAGQVEYHRQIEDAQAAAAAAAAKM